MAFISADKVKKKKTGGDTGAVTPPVGATGGGQGIQAPTKQSSGYVNLQKYVDNTDSSRIGESLVGKATEDSNQYKEEVTAAGSEALDKTPTAVSGYDSEDLKNVGTDPDAKGRIKGVLDTVTPETPTVDFSKSANTKSKLESFLESTKTPSTMSTGLKQIAGPQYTSGMAGLDTALLASSKDSQEAINTFGDTFETETAGLPEATQAVVDSAFTGADTTTKATQDLLLTDIKDMLDGITGEGGSLATDIAAEEAIRQGKLDAVLPSRNVSKKELIKRATDKLIAEGISPDAAFKSAGISMPTFRASDYYTPTEVDYTDVMTPEQQAQIAALSDLSGTESAYGGALGADESPYTFNESEYKSDLDAAISGIMKSMRPDPVEPEVVEEIIPQHQGTATVAPLVEATPEQQQESIEALESITDNSGEIGQPGTVDMNYGLPSEVGVAASDQMSLVQQLIDEMMKQGK